MLCLADCSLVQVCLAQSSIQCSGSSFQFGQFIHPWLVCLPLQCTSPCSGSGQVGNFPTDIETSSLPAACHGYYQIHHWNAVHNTRKDKKLRWDGASAACRVTGWQPLMGIQGQNICSEVPDDFCLTGKFIIFTQQSFPGLLELQLWCFFSVDLIKSD